jgi:hypothetical protein
MWKRVHKVDALFSIWRQSIHHYHKILNEWAIYNIVVFYKGDLNLIKNVIICLMIFLILPIGTFSAAETESQPLYKTAKELLPTEAEFIKPKTPESVSSIQVYDFNQDGQQEMLVTFRLEKGVGKLHAMLLKKEEKQWKKIWDTTSEGFDIEYSGIEDITGDGVGEFVIAWGIGASAGNKLEIYRWEEETLKRIIEPRFFHRMELLKGENQTSVALWERYCCDAFLVDVLTWNSKDLVRDEDLFRQYYPKVKSFYEAKIKKLDAWFYWYALADAQLKANLMNEATESIHKGLTFIHGKEEFNELRRRLEEKTSPQNATP